MIERIKALLAADAGVSNYRINTVKTESSELFFVHRSLETVRATDTDDVKVTVFVEHDGKLGDATFSVYASYDDEKIKSEIEAAKKKAALIDNESYPLPANETANVPSDSNFRSFAPQELGAKIADAVFAADREEGGSLNAVEVFVYRDVVRVVNSRGIDKTEVKHRAMVEAIPTWTENGESVELYECYNFTEFDAATVTAEIARRMAEVRDRYHAVKPETPPSCPTVLMIGEIAELLNELSRELNFASVYQKANAFSKGDAIQKDPQGDTLTVTLCGKMLGSVNSAAFDGEGCTLRDTEIVKDGVATAYFGGVRFASYLGEEPTGNLRCLRLEAGSLTKEDLGKAPYFRVASMSGLQLDIYSDYIGGEVRLGYYFDGEKEIPMTGVSLSGKLSEALSTLRLSRETGVWEGYEGPTLALIPTMEIV